MCYPYIPPKGLKSRHISKHTTLYSLVCCTSEHIDSGGTGVPTASEILPEGGAEHRDSLAPQEVLGEAGSSGLPFKTPVHYHALAFCIALSEKMLLIPPGCF